MYVTSGVQQIDGRLQQKNPHATSMGKSEPGKR